MYILDDKDRVLGLECEEVTGWWEGWSSVGVDGVDISWVGGSELTTGNPGKHWSTWHCISGWCSRGKGPADRARGKVGCRIQHEGCSRKDEREVNVFVVEISWSISLLVVRMIGCKRVSRSPGETQTARKSLPEMWDQWANEAGVDRQLRTALFCHGRVATMSHGEGNL